MNNSNNSDKIKPQRSGCKDIWNAHMCKNASFSQSKWDIPYCPTTANTIPSAIITWDEAKQIHKKLLARGDKDYFFKAFVCFYIDDYKFDGARGIWHDYNFCLKVLRHFEGVITPDYSTYQDFPAALKIYNTYRMRVYGFWLGKNGIPVINNVRWGTEESYSYCFDGVPKNSIVAIGTVGGSPRKHIDRERFEKGLEKLVETLTPKIIIVYGSSNYPCFEKLKEQGIRIVSYQGCTSAYFDRRRNHE